MDLWDETERNLVELNAELSRSGDSARVRYMLALASSFFLALLTDFAPWAPIRPSGRALARAPVGGGFPAPPFR